MRAMLTILTLLTLTLTLTVSGSMCPLEPITPSEASSLYAEGSISNGGTVNGVLFMGSSNIVGVVGNSTGYGSTASSFVGKGAITYADTLSFVDSLSRETGLSIGSGRAIYEESAAYDYVTDTPSCEVAYSSTGINIVSGQFASDMYILPAGTNLMQHNAAVSGTGSFSAGSGYSFMTNESYSRSSDRVFAIGDLKFARQVSFKSVKS